ncbi:hypothetical protein GCM10007908_03610 [Rhizobium albus]|nr:hypothetical protein GCM10007908_03610 [Rhizobium albus]
MNAYRTRMLNARDPRYAKIHDAIYGRRDVQAVAPAPVETLADVRAEYERVLGKRPFNGWGIEELRAKIAAAKA